MIVVLSVVVLLGFTIASFFDEQIQANDLIPSDAKNTSTELISHYPGIIDNIFLFFVVMLAIAVIALAALVRVHPVFLIFFIIALFILILLSAVLSNIYQEMAANSTLITFADQLTFFSLILNALPFIVAVIGVTVMIILYKVGGGGDQVV